MGDFRVFELELKLVLSWRYSVGEIIGSDHVDIVGERFKLLAIEFNIEWYLNLFFFMFVVVEGELILASPSDRLQLIHLFR